MSTLRCLVIEDEPLAASRLRDYVGRLPHLTLVAVVADAEGALPFLGEGGIDLLIVDVELGRLSGLDLLEVVRTRAQVIVVTATATHAVRAFELGVADYLLKPVAFPRFVQAVDRATTLRAGPVADPANTPFFIRTEHRFERVPLAELRMIEGDGDRRLVHLGDRTLVTSETLTDLERRLPGHLFCRVHKSWIVSLGHVAQVERDRLVVGTQRIPISDGYRARVLARVGG